MKVIEIPAFTDEYKIIVAIGTIKELPKYIVKNVEGWSLEEAEEQVKRTRGTVWDRLNGSQCKNPLITIDGDLPFDIALATLAHETSHAASYIMSYLHLEDPSDEFKANIISTVLRNTVKHFKIKP